MLKKPQSVFSTKIEHYYAIKPIKCAINNHAVDCVMTGDAGRLNQQRWGGTASTFHGGDTNEMRRWSWVNKIIQMRAA